MVAGGGPRRPASRGGQAADRAPAGEGASGGGGAATLWREQGRGGEKRQRHGEPRVAAEGGGQEVGQMYTQGPLEGGSSGQGTHRRQKKIELNAEAAQKKKKRGGRCVGYVTGLRVRERSSRQTKGAATKKKGVDRPEGLLPRSGSTMTPATTAQERRKRKRQGPDGNRPSKRGGTAGQAAFVCADRRKMV